MSEHVERNLPNHEQCERTWMNRNGEEDDRRNSCLHERLPRAERIRCPRTRASGKVMCVVKHSVEPAMVHHAVRPIEVRIMDKDDQSNTDDEISPAVLVNSKIHLSPAVDYRLDHQRGHETEDGYAAQRVQNLPTVLSGLGNITANASLMKLRAESDIENEPNNARDEPVPEKLCQRGTGPST